MSTDAEKIEAQRRIYMQELHAVGPVELEVLLRVFRESSKPSAPAPSPEHLCECGHNKVNHYRNEHGINNGPCMGEMDCPCTHFKPDRSPVRTEACPHGCVDGWIYGKGLFEDSECPLHWDTPPLHGSAPKCPNPDCVEGMVTDGPLEEQAGVTGYAAKPCPLHGSSPACPECGKGMRPSIDRHNLLVCWDPACNGTGTEGGGR